MSELRLTIPGTPFAWQRARKGGRRHFTSPEMRARQDEVRLRARVALAGRTPAAGAVVLEVLAYMPIPESWSKRKRAAAAAGEVRPTVKPDADNFGKLVADALNGIAYRDDAQAVDVIARKFYGAEPRTEIVVRPVGEGGA